MKRGSVNSHQFYGSFDDRKVKHKYHCLSEDFLELQKEFVSKKKKLQTQEQKRDMLVEEVRFLRQRYNYLTKSQFSKVESELFVNQNVPIRRDLNHVINKEGTGREVLTWMKPCMKKKLNNGLPNDNESRKRKISWQDKVDLGD
ncbi:hypothetical protein QN277_015273 [Acacia crassicarpa]|nr:hypothetical protein QN277_015273 [Acacia crassicarpa]